uniref:Selenide, water dikinase n=1 Tax=Magnetococcus massalia (strain MO-1) TaxID=451514 RepID=A0A1S7LCG7_MAGMO|nr:Selenide, water dikinase [Candidatus Magnetococcus massalia]
MDEIKLTEFSPGAGCGCKISPKDLETILHSGLGPSAPDGRLLVGNSSNDDAAVFDMGNGEAVVSTTDFFTPIVNDPFQFGQIASVNAISDIYAMGGQPLMAIGILGWPLKKLSNEVAQQVVAGARDICSSVGMALAGGHSIDIGEPIFGLAVTGRVTISQLKRNNSAQPGAKLFLTKPIGVGILTTAEKKKLLRPEHAGLAVSSMVKLNRVGERFAQLDGVQAMTDVTGFGLLGHLSEMCQGSGINAVVRAAEVPMIHGIHDYVAQGSVPGGTNRNWQSYGHKMTGVSDDLRPILCDPQTSGGLLVAVADEGVDAFLAVAAEEGLTLQSFGETLPRESAESGPYIQVK